MHKLLKRVFARRRASAPPANTNTKKPTLSDATQRNLLRVFIDSRRVS